MPRLARVFIARQCNKYAGSFTTFYSCVFSGTCFDVENNVMWCCSSDWVDQFCNPGHQAPHHVKARLGISQSSLAGSSGKSVF